MRAGYIRTVLYLRLKHSTLRVGDAASRCLECKAEIINSGSQKLLASLKTSSIPAFSQGRMLYFA